MKVAGAATPVATLITPPTLGLRPPQNSILTMRHQTWREGIESSPRQNASLGTGRARLGIRWDASLLPSQRRSNSRSAKTLEVQRLRPSRLGDRPKNRFVTRLR